MEGGFRFLNLPKNPPPPPPLPFRPTAPLTAIDRFLLSQSHFSNQTTPPSNNNHSSIQNGFCDFSSSSSLNKSLVDSFFMEGETTTLNWMHGENNIIINNSNNNSNFGLKNHTKGSGGKRGKGGVGGSSSSSSSSSAPLIKGQWTDEEDRKLMRLVKQYGVRKWAQIAERMIGRAGKQCRERWHNHLRPDIKKDIWSEEEERLLVEAHEEVGNKWAEIAKRIKGRTENSIKNHWNATKRRQNSRRKSKKQEGPDGAKPQSTILQDYIRSKVGLSNNTGGNNIGYISNNSSKIAAAGADVTCCPSATGTAITPRTNSSISEDPSSTQFNEFCPEFSPAAAAAATTADDVEGSSSLITSHTYDDELNFMLSFFGNNKVVGGESMVAVNDEKMITSEAVEKPVATEKNDNDSGFNPLGFINQSAMDDQLLIHGASYPPTPNNPYNNNLSKFQKDEEEEDSNSSKTPLNSDLYISYLLDGGGGGGGGSSHCSSSSSSSSSSYGNMMMKMDFLMGDQCNPHLETKKEMDLIEMVTSSSHYNDSYHFSPGGGGGGGGSTDCSYVI